MRKATILIALLFCSLFHLRAQTVSDLFQPRTGLSKNYTTIASKYQSLELDSRRLISLRNQAPQSMKLELPFENKQLKLDLRKVKITADNFKVTEALPGGGRRTVEYNDGIFYQGKIEGHPSSFATISLVGGQVMGVIADEESNIILGAIEEKGIASNEYTLYREKNLQVPNPVHCFTSDQETIGIPTTNTNSHAKGNITGAPVDIYFECDNKLFQDKGSSTINVINYVLGFFNNTVLLYDNEDIKVQVSEILVWTTQDPEAAAGLNSTSTALTSFRNRMAVLNFNGDYAHFLSRRNLGGGIAYILDDPGPCSSQKQFRTGVSAIDNSYANFPTYSWTVEVVTHELGHNFGSQHTQWCGWTGGALDNCVATEAFPTGSTACPPGPTPSNGGTIMSYCHLTGIGINFNNGFGVQPGNRIREKIGAATCFGIPCTMTIVVNKQDASCNQDNGSATVVATNSTGTLTYLWSNGQTGATLTNAAPGTYHVKATDANGCSVVEDIVIGNSGSTLSFSLTPATTAAICNGSNVTLTATSNPAYTYQWSVGGNPIPGALSNTYTTNAIGNYSVTVVSGICSGTKSVQVVQVTTPVAAITAGSATTFCSGNSVSLTANGGAGFSYQWYNNGNPINGATNASYSAVATGSYTVKISAGAACESTSSATAVTVNPSPTANITLTGQASFCEGNSVLLSSSTGTGYAYQWYRNGGIISDATEATYTASTAGSYTLVTSLGTCSVTSAATTITVLPRPTVVITPEISTIEKFQSRKLTGSGASTYNWSSVPDMINSTATTGTYRPLTTTDYVFEGTAANSCKNTATARIIVIGCGDVTNLTATTYSPSRVLLTWTNPADVTTDSLQYRKLGETTWSKVFVSGTSFELTGLEPNTDYEYNIIPLCTSSTVFLPSDIQTFKTAALQNGRFVRLFPNPVTATSRLEIIVTGSFTLETAIFDNTGKRIYQWGSSSQLLSGGQYIQLIEGEKLANGIYFISVTINGKKENIKMMVAH